MRSDALRGHLDALLLATLDRGPLHGYAIMESLQTRTGGALDLPTGTVYPALRRLERAEYLRGDWATVAGRRRRTYWLTSEGRRALAAERIAWREFTTVIDRVLSVPPRRSIVPRPVPGLVDGVRPADEPGSMGIGPAAVPRSGA